MNKREVRSTPHTIQQRKQSQGVINDWTLLITFPQTSLLLLSGSFVVFEDNETVIKMISKGRSPTMTHVSRTHRVALDWLFGRIKLDTKNPNQIH